MKTLILLLFSFYCFSQNKYVDDKNMRIRVNLEKDVMKVWCKKLKPRVSVIELIAPSRKVVYRSTSSFDETEFSLSFSFLDCVNGYYEVKVRTGGVTEKIILIKMPQAIGDLKKIINFAY